MSSGIAPLEADYKGPNTTAEGDFIVLLLQTAKFLMKAYRSLSAQRHASSGGADADAAKLAEGAITLHGSIIKPLAVGTAQPPGAVLVAGSGANNLHTAGWHRVSRQLWCSWSFGQPGPSEDQSTDDTQTGPQPSAVIA